MSRQLFLAQLPGEGQNDSLKEKDPFSLQAGAMCVCPFVFDKDSVLLQRIQQRLDALQG